MFGMKPPKAELPAVSLTAVMVRGKTVYKKKLPLAAMNAAIYQIFTAENMEAMRKFPDSIEERP
jgi:hypothetical protein